MIASVKNFGTKAKMTGLALAGIVLADIASVSALTSSGGVVTIDSADLTNVSDSIDNLLATVFEVLKLLPYVALIIGGFYLLDRLFGILPKPGSGGR